MTVNAGWMPALGGGHDGQRQMDARARSGTSWLKALNTAHFKPGIHRAQRFLEGSWLAPQEHGYRRAIPLRCLAAFPAKAIGSTGDGLKEWQAGLAFVQWLRTTLDELGRCTQRILALSPVPGLLAQKGGRHDRLEQRNHRRRTPLTTVLPVLAAKNRHSWPSASLNIARQRTGDASPCA